jgi:hypothetical protein
VSNCSRALKVIFTQKRGKKRAELNYNEFLLISAVKKAVIRRMESLRKLIFAIFGLPQGLKPASF